MKECTKRYVTIHHKDGRKTSFPQTPDLNPWTIGELRDMIDPKAVIGEIEEAPYIELTKDEAAAVLETAQVDEGKIFYQGKWLPLCRATLTDDVRTAGRYATAEAWRQAMRFGARIDQRHFAIIDQYSDG